MRFGAGRRRGGRGSGVRGAGVARESGGAGVARESEGRVWFGPDGSGVGEVRGRMVQRGGAVRESDDSGGGCSSGSDGSGPDGSRRIGYGYGYGYGADEGWG
ncbi:hypothetical protein JCM9957A_54270 [Kineosporia succinea]